MNKVTLHGRLTRDVELRYIQGSGMAVASFVLAVDKGLSKEKKEEMQAKNLPTADFITCQAWGKQAENIAKFTTKGLRLLISGKIQTGSYEKNGQRIYTTIVVVDQSEFIDWKDTNNTKDTFQAPIDDDFEYEPDFDPLEDNRIPF